MNSTNPLIINGKVYDKFNITLALSTRFDDSEDASLALTLTPARYENGIVEQSTENNQTVLFGSKSVADQPTLIALEEILTAIQKLITTKEL